MNLIPCVFNILAMPYLILIVGLLIGLYALYRFFISASVKEVKALFLTGILVVLGIAVFLLAVTGRFPAAMAIMVAIVPIAISMRKARLEQNRNKDGDIILSDDDVEVIPEDDSDEES